MLLRSTHNRMPRNYLAELERRVLIFDGSMGASLQTLELSADDFGGLRYEGCIDALCVTRPDAPARLHRGFLEAGCDVVETNTFQASRLRLEEWGLADKTYAINAAGAAIARRECDAFEQIDGRPRFVAGSTGPEHMREPVRYLVQNTRTPISVIPNAGIPINLGGGKALYPLEPPGLAEALAEFVHDFGVNAVGGCCGTTFEHLQAVVECVAGKTPRPRIVANAAPRVASSIRAFELRQNPPPTLVGDRVNTQGSRKVKRLLLANEYDGVLAIARDQVEGGAHLLDVCVALTERPDEAQQMIEVVKRLRSSVEAPLVLDSTERDVLERALEAYPGRPVLNSFNLEAGREKADFVLGLAEKHGAFVVAMTIDEVGMAHTADRKVEVARRIHALACDEHGLPPERLIFDVLTFPVTTGQEDLRDDAHQTIEGIRRVNAELPGVLTVLGLSNVSFGISLAARGVLNSAFLYHCVQAGLDLAIVNPVHLTPYAEIDAEHRALAEDLIYNRREDALARFLAAFEGIDVQSQKESADDGEVDLPVDERIHGRILHRKKEGIETLLDEAIDQRTASQTTPAGSGPPPGRSAAAV